MLSSVGLGPLGVYLRQRLVLNLLGNTKQPAEREGVGEGEKRGEGDDCPQHGAH